MSTEQARQLDSWLRRLADLHAVVTYHPDTEDGFYYVDGEPSEDGIPILR